MWERAGDGVRYVVLALVLAGAVVLARRSEGRLAALMVVLPVAVTVAVSLAGLHVFTTRNLIVVAPFACIALAAVPSAIPSRPLALAATVAVAVGAVWSFSLDRQRDRTPYDRVGETLADFGWTGREPRGPPRQASEPARASRLAPPRPSTAPTRAAGTRRVRARVRPRAEPRRARVARRPTPSSSAASAGSPPTGAARTGSAPRGPGRRRGGVDGRARRRAGRPALRPLLRAGRAAAGMRRAEAVSAWPGRLF